nr:olfactory receptor 52N2-like [Pelodiscus sinensis]|eukprot:XP_025042041.1 olfactory receptor 52N2-like [Pelodiscus sinensis]
MADEVESCERQSTCTVAITLEPGHIKEVSGRHHSALNWTSPYSMSNSNTTVFTNGIPGLEAAHVWISIPFCIMYIIALLGNFAILFIVKTEPSLHEPMYYFLCLLAVTDLVLCTSILPKMLGIFYFNSREIDFNSCFTQMFFVHGFSVIDSGIFVAMAVDRYVAISHPLRYSTIMTNSVVAISALTVVLRGIILILPLVLVAKQWPYCRTNIIPHTQCGHMGVILRAIFRLPTKDNRIKTFGTCGSHLCAMKVPQYFNVLMSNLCFLVPPMLNPIIYGVKTKQIQERLLGLVKPKGT